MECPSCYELYNVNLNIPLNLLCGHTFCKLCIKRLFNYSQVKCPMCSQPSQFKNIEQLSKNFVALSLADEHTQKTINQKKTEFNSIQSESQKNKNQENKDLCEIHSEKLRYFCKTDKKIMCPSCIVDHSGHQFVKIELSQYNLQKKYDAVKLKFQKMQDNQKIMSSYLNENLEKINYNEKIQLEKIDNDFDLMIKIILESKEQLKEQLLEKVNMKKNQNNINESFLQAFDIEINQNEQLIQETEVELQKDEIEDQEIKKNLDLLEQKLEKINEKAFELYLEIDNEKQQENEEIITDYRKIKKIKMISQLKCEKKQQKFCLFGYKDKMLELDLKNHQYSLKSIKMVNNQSREFQYYSAAVSTKNGDIILTGGSATNQVVLVQLQKRKIKYLSEMKECRKEHCAVIDDNFIYVLGGYNAVQNSFLSECERYSLLEDQWMPIASMNSQKCAFSSCLVKSQNNIYVFGGYTGSKRIADIEVYSIDKDQWTDLPFALPTPLSNSAAIYNPIDHKIILLGGGHSQGYLNNIYVLDLQSSHFQTITSISEGKDLRNKLIFYRNYIYMVGGNNQQLERINLNNYQQEKINVSYSHLLNDNLDSWAAALTSYDYDSPSNLQAIVDQSLKDAFLFLDHNVSIPQYYDQYSQF